MMLGACHLHWPSGLNLGRLKSVASCSSVISALPYIISASLVSLWFLVPARSAGGGWLTAANPVPSFAVMCECHLTEETYSCLDVWFQHPGGKKLRIHIAIRNPIFRPNNPMQCNNWAFH